MWLPTFHTSIFAFQASLPSHASFTFQHSPRSLTPCRPAGKMPTSKLSGTGARRTPRTTPRHTWTTDQKRCLLLLNSRFQLSSDEITKTFNQVFKAEIDTAGFPDGIPWRSLQAQYRERKQDDNVGWLKITRPESWETELACRNVLIERIQDCLPSNAAKRADRQTPERARSTSPEPRGVSARRKRSRDVLELDDSDEEPSSPSKSPRTVTVVVLRSEGQAAKADVVADKLARADLISLKSKPRTPTKSLKKSGFTRTGPLPPPGYHLFKRPRGPPIWLTPTELARARNGWISPSEQEAHPPLAGLFFRSLCYPFRAFCHRADHDVASGMLGTVDHLSARTVSSLKSTP